MSQNLQLTRRAAICVVAIVGVFGGDWGFECFGNHSRAEMVKKIAGFYPHKKDAAIIGIAYLNSAPEEMNVNKIVDRMCPKHSDKFRELAKANSDEAHDIIARWQRDDFEHGRIVNVSGWLLSETEAHTCALTALTFRC